MKKDEAGFSESEAGLFGSIVVDPNRVMTLMSRMGVKADWFETEAGRVTAEIVFGMYAAGTPIDLLTVCNELGKSGRRDLARMVESAFADGAVVAHSEYYADSLKEKWFVRSAIESASSLIARMREGDTAPKLVVAEMMDSMVALISENGKGSHKSAYEIRCELINEWDAARGTDKAMGVPWPFECMNLLTCGLFPGINVLAARPSVGKTAFEGAVIRELLMRGYRVARACLDMESRQFLSRDVCALGGESLNKMRAGYATESDIGKLRLTNAAMSEWKDREFIIEERTSEGICAVARVMVANGGLDMLTVDYAQLLDVTVSGRDNDNVRISKAVARLKDFSLSTGVPVLLLSQLSREVEKDGRRPQLSDLRDSGSIEQEASTVTFIYAEPSVTKTWLDKQGLKDFKELNIRAVVWDLMKNQNGKTGLVGLRQIGEYFRFEQAVALRKDDYRDEDCAWGYNFAEPQGPDRSNAARMQATRNVGMYVICRHPLGAIEAFDAQWFEKINERAAKDGVAGYEEMSRVLGCDQAMNKLKKIRNESRELLRNN
jgi:replicative DNA helicase